MSCQPSQLSSWVPPPAPRACYCIDRVSAAGSGTGIAGTTSRRGVSKAAAGRHSNANDTSIGCRPRPRAWCAGPVWDLSRHSAGMAVRFRTNARTIHADYELLSASLAMPHMPATGVSGLDLYGELTEGDERWVQVLAPTAQTMQQAIVSGLDGATAHLHGLPAALQRRELAEDRRACGL